MALRTSIAGIPLENPLMNASGCLCSTATQLAHIEFSHAAAVVSKSATIRAQDGNAEPRFYMDNIGAINSMGNPNPGYKYYIEYASKRRNFGKTEKPYIMSVYPYHTNELDVIIPEIFANDCAVELNVSCPNVGINTNFAKYDTYFDKMHQLSNNGKIWGIKLPPLFHQPEFEHMSHMLLKHQPNFITSINTVPRGLILDPVTFLPKIAPYNGLGGISGKYIKPIGLSNVYQFSTLLKNKIDIIGCGGISSGQDVLEYMAAGARAVQIGSHLNREGTDCFEKIESELFKLVGNESITNFIGRAHVRLSAL